MTYKTYSVETLRAKRDSLSAKVKKAKDARDRAERMLENMQKNKNLWRQFCDINGVAPDCNIGDWMA